MKKRKNILIAATLGLAITGLAFTKHQHHDGDKTPPKRDLTLTIFKTENGKTERTETVIENATRESVKAFFEERGIKKEDLEFYRSGPPRMKHHDFWVYHISNGKEGDCKNKRVKFIELDGEELKGEDIKIENHSIKIETHVDDNGNKTIKKWVDGKEVDPNDSDADIQAFEFKIDEGDLEELIIKIDSSDANSFKVRSRERGDKKVIVMTHTDTEEIDLSDGKHHRRMVHQHRHHSPTRGNFAAKSKDGSLHIFGTYSSDEGEGNRSNLSENNLAVEALKFYPNPAQNEVTISFTSPSENEVNISIKDLQGKEVFSKNYTENNSGAFSNKLDLSDKTSGIYIVTITQNDKSLTKKLIIE